MIPPEASTWTPYVGPRAFAESEQDRFFGREREARDVLAQVVAERMVVFYAQSGAGKTSMINTRLIPGLRAEGFEVLPVARVSGVPPEGVHPRNVYVFNLIASILVDDPTFLDPPQPLSTLASMSLAAFLGSGDTPDGIVQPSAPTVLIVDQFEEIFTTHPDQWQSRTEFFRQLRAVQNRFPSLWLVLTMREDFIAHLDPLAAHLANGLPSRFYMQRMGQAAALEAITRPAARAGRPFANGVAETLVDNLRQLTRASGRESGTESGPGEFVEPLQLQVVCYQLWARLSAKVKDGRSGPITEQSLETALGGQNLAEFVDRALADYYEQALRTVLEAPELDVSERELRDWFSSQLLTPDGTRGMVFQGTHTTSGLPNAAVALLASQLLIRAEPRSGGIWYELVHDRFVEPILEANRAWQLRQSDPLTTATRTWLVNNRDPAGLLSGRDLADAQRFARDNPRALGDDERAFLAASERRLAEEQLKSTRRTRSVAGMIVLIFAVVAGFALFQRQDAVDARAALEPAATAVAASQATLQPLATAAASGQATLQPLATAEAGAREMVQARATAQTVEGAQRALATAANTALSVDPQRSLLLALNAVNIAQSQHQPLTQEVVAAVQQAVQTSHVVSMFGAHSAAIRAVAISSDGTRVATASKDKTVQLWTWPASGHTPVLTLNHSSAALSLAFSHDGARLASGTTDGTVTIWDAATGADLSQVLIKGVGKDARVASLAFNPDDKQLAVAADDSYVRLVDPEAGTVTAELQTPNAAEGVAFSPDGGRLAAVIKDGPIMFWNTATNAEEAPFASRGGAPVMDAAASQISYSPDGRYLATSGSSVKIWDLQGAREPVDLPASGSEYPNVIAFSGDGMYLATGGGDRTIRIWQTASPSQPVLTLSGHSDVVRGLAFHPNGDRLISVGDDMTGRVWNSLPFGLHSQRINDVAFSPDGQRLASAGDDGTVFVWSTESGDLALGPLTHLKFVNRVAFNPDGSARAVLATASADSTAGVWDSTGTLLKQLSGHSDEVEDVAFSRDGNLLATASRDSTAEIWDVASLSMRTKIEVARDEWVYSAAFSPDGTLLATGSSDGTTRLWNVSTGAAIPIAPGPNISPQTSPAVPLVDMPPACSTVRSSGCSTRTHGAWRVVFSPDGAMLATASFNGQVDLLDVRSRTVRLSWLAHSGRVTAVAFSPDGRQLATAGEDGAVKLWDPQSGALQLSLSHSAAMRAVAFSGDGKTLATAGDDRQIHMYPLEIRSLLQLASARVTRPLSADDCRSTYVVDTCAPSDSNRELAD